MAAKHRTPRRAIAAIVSFLLTACIPATAESEMPISAPAPGTPLISIHNPLVLPVGDTPLSSGGPFQGWPGVEVERHGLKIFHPHGWLFASSQEQLRALRPQLDEAEMADALLTERESYVDSLTPAGQEQLFAGTGFPFDPHSPPLETNGFHLLAVPSEGRSLETYARELAAQLQASGLALVRSIEIGPGLRPWGEQVATIRYRIDGVRAFRDRVVTVPRPNVDGRQVVLLSPDGGTFLTVTYDLWGEHSEWVEGLLHEVVRRVQWLEDPALKPHTGPTVASNHSMNVRRGPGTDHPVIGGAAADQQFAAISRNASGDWWQIVFDGRLAWLHNDYVTASADADDVPLADGTGWLKYDDDASGLSISFPSTWRYFDPARPTAADLALFSAAVRYDSEQFDVAGLGQMVSTMTYRRDDAVTGLGLHTGPAGREASNFVLVFTFAANGQTLKDYAQAAAAHTYSITPARVRTSVGLRPSGEEVVLVRYRENETNNEVWQAWLLSPDGETLAALAFSIHSDEIAALRPVLNEIVRRLRWTG